MADNISFNHAMTFNKEIVIPSFDTKELLDAYTPAREGAIATVGDDVYSYNGTAWINSSSSGNSTYRGSINDL